VLEGTQEEDGRQRTEDRRRSTLNVKRSLFTTGTKKKKPSAVSQTGLPIPAFAGIANYHGFVDFLGEIGEHTMIIYYFSGHYLEVWMKVLVTGAAGFIGSHLCERLLGQGHGVVGLDNFDGFYDPAIKRANIAGCMGNKGFELIEGDIRDREAVTKIAAGGFAAIVHLAAKAGVRPSIEDPVGYADVNVNGTAAMLEAARRAGVQKFVFASSSSVYGNNAKVPFSETDNVDYPISPYAATKKAGELLCHTYAHLFEMGVTCLRFFTVYGPRQRPDLAIHKFGRLIEAGKEIPVYGDGSMMRDFTYIDDIIDGVARAMERCAGYAIYNLGESEPVSVMELIAALERALGKRAIIKYLPKQAGDVERTFADIHKAQRELGFEPRTRLDEGIGNFVKWLRKF
jgi:UDP-glucuronate 4-epimerase